MLGVVLYKNQMAVVTHLSQLEVHLEDMNILLDLKQMRDLSHDNVNPFIGISTDSPHVCILMAYAPRGRLCDIIADDEICSSTEFKVSFI